MLAGVACATAGSKRGDAGGVTPADRTSEGESPSAQSAPPAVSPAPPSPPPAAPSSPAPPAPAPDAPPAAAPPPQAPAPPAPEASPAAGTATADVAAYMADPQAIQRASQLFRAVCTGYCHSTQPTAERVAPNLFDCAWDHGGSDEEVFHSISAGIPDTQMQGFGEKLPQEDLWKLVAYLRQRSTCK
jgi:mono/diheme cytochrome c family protein